MFFRILHHMSERKSEFIDALNTSALRNLFRRLLRAQKERTQPSVNCEAANERIAAHRHLTAIYGRVWREHRQTGSLVDVPHAQALVATARVHGKEPIVLNLYHIGGCAMADERVSALTHTHTNERVRSRAYTRTLYARVQVIRSVCVCARASTRYYMIYASPSLSSLSRHMHICERTFEPSAPNE